MENRYDVAGNLMNFGAKSKYFLTFGLNNIGSDKVGNLTDMFYNASDMESVETFNANPNVIMGLSAGGTLLKEHRIRFNNAETVSFNTIVPLSSKIKAKFSGFLGFDELNSYRNSVDFTKTNTVSFTNYEKEQYLHFITDKFLVTKRSYSQITLFYFLQSYRSSFPDFFYHLPRYIWQFLRLRKKSLTILLRFW